MPVAERSQFITYNFKERSDKDMEPKHRAGCHECKARLKPLLSLKRPVVPRSRHQSVATDTSRWPSHHRPSNHRQMEHHSKYDIVNA